MGKIFCLIGKSSTGKDTIFKELVKDKALGLKPIVGYTTRPKRSNETNGVEYFFISLDELKEYRSKDKVIEERVYNTTKGAWYYSTLDDGQIDFNNNYIIITTVESFKNIKEYYGNKRVIPIYINIDDKARLERAICRESVEENPNYNEVCRRFIADSIDFKEENLLEAGISKKYYNIDLKGCIESIKLDMKKYIN